MKALGSFDRPRVLRVGLFLLPCLVLAASTTFVACADDRFLGAIEGDGGSDAVGAADAAEAVRDAGEDPDARGAFDPAEEPVTCTVPTCATQLVAGGDHFCARMNDGTVRCWGGDSFGALGGSMATEMPDGGVAVGVVQGLGGVTQLSAGGGTTCARTEDGGVHCWGDNRQAELGLAVEPAVFDEDAHSEPAPVALGEPAVRVDVAQGSACALLASGKLACWGKDDQKQLASESDAGVDIEHPVRGPGIAGVGSLSFARTSGGTFTRFGLDSAGQVFSWGALAGDEGIISGRVASVSPDSTPRRIESLEQVTSVAASVWIQPPWDPPPWNPGEPPPENKPPKPRGHACAIAAGEVYCWGASNAGALCTGIPDKEQEPRRAPFTAKTWPQQLAVADEITCARMMDGTVQCCGSDTRGRLGTGSVGVLSAFFQRASAFSGHAVRVATSNGAVCALVQGGTVECWGSNEKGELGRKPDLEPHPSPSKIEFQ